MVGTKGQNGLNLIVEADGTCIVVLDLNALTVTIIEA